jgi:hypothetical protein
MRITFENPVSIVYGLRNKPLDKALKLHLVMHTVMSRQIPDDKNDVQQGHCDTGNVVNQDRCIEGNERRFVTGKVEVHP